MNLFSTVNKKLDFNLTTIDRALREEAINKDVKILKITLIILCIIFSIFILRALIMNYLQQEIAVAEMQNSLMSKVSNISKETHQSKKDINYKKLAKQQIFGKIGLPNHNDENKSNKEKEVPITKVELKLLGVFMWGDGLPSATIAESKKPDSEENYFVNDMINDSTKLVAVYSDKVEIETNGVREALYFDDAKISTSSSGNEGAAEDVIKVDERELDNALSNLPMLLQQARAVPYFKDGKSIGLRLFAIRPGSLYEKVGLQNGDILKEINGTSLSDITQAVKLFERLKSEKNITLKLERQREDKTLLYEIR